MRLPWRKYGPGTPLVTVSQVNTNGTWHIFFQEPVVVTSAAGITFHDSVSGTLTASYASGSGTSQLIVGLSPYPGNGDTLTWDYNAALGNISGLGPWFVPLASFMGKSVVNESFNFRPTVSSVTVSANGTTVTVALSDNCTFHTGFTISMSGGAATLTYVSGDPGSSFVFTSSRTITSAETGTWTYTPGNVVNTANALAMLSGTGSVTNDSAQGPSVRASSAGTIAMGSGTVLLPTRQSGDILEVYVAASASLPAANTGWARQFTKTDGNAGTTAFGLYTKTSDGTDSTGPLASTLAGGGCFACVSIANPASGLDGTGQSNGNSTSVAAPSISPAGSVDVLVSAYLVAAGTAGIVTPLGQSKVGPSTDGATVTLALGYQTLAASGATGTRTATISSAGWAASNTCVE